MFRPFATFLYAAALACTVLAQEINIALPQANTKVKAGSDIIVKLDKPMSLTGSEEVVVVIGAFPCSSECPGASEVLGDILYNGAYSPKLYPDDWDPYQNLTVTVPSWYSGLVQLGVAHVFLLGAGQSAQLQFMDVTLNVD